jgi:capsular exopolysaccharide synthesis family protein
MGEIADALRRADPLEPPRKEQRHGRKSEGDHGVSSRPPTPEPVVATRPQAEAEPNPVEHQVVHLLGDRAYKSIPARISVDEPRSHFAQQYRRLAIRLGDLANSRHARSIMITSAQPGDGKTTTACNLAIALAMTDHDRRVALVDLDLHRASIAAALGIRVEIPIDAVLRGECTLEQATMETDVAGLSILAANSPARDAEHLLAQHTLAAMIAKLESRFDWVIIDSPPILATSDAQVILQHASAALLVVRAGASPVRAVHKALGHLPKKKILACFLNSSRTKSQRHDGYYYDDYRNSEDLEPAPSTNSEEIEKIDVERN